MRKKKIFILLGHSDPATLSGALADTYEREARAAGHDVRRMDLCHMDFDPILHEGYKTIQELEPDLKEFQENMKWCEHFVLVYPTWWSSMPALLKGLFDRAWLPHFCFNYAHHGLTWKKLLKGRTGRVITSLNSAPWVERFVYGPPTVVAEFCILRFAGVRARSTVFGPSERASDRKKARWFRKVERLGREGK